MLTLVLKVGRTFWERHLSWIWMLVRNYAYILVRLLIPRPGLLPAVVQLVFMWICREPHQETHSGSKSCPSAFNLGHHSDWICCVGTTEREVKIQLLKMVLDYSTWVMPFILPVLKMWGIRIKVHDLIPSFRKPSLKNVSWTDPNVNYFSY